MSRDDITDMTRLVDELSLHDDDDHHRRTEVSETNETNICSSPFLVDGDMIMIRLDRRLSLVGSNEIK